MAKNKIKTINEAEAFFDMNEKISDIIENPCCYCYDKNKKSYPNCPWFDTGDCNPAKNMCRVGNIKL